MRKNLAFAAAVGYSIGFDRSVAAFIDRGGFTLSLN